MEEIRVSGFDIIRVKRTQLEMVRDRGYDIPEEELEFLGNDLNNIYGYFEKIFLSDIDETDPSAEYKALNRVYDGPNLPTLVVYYISPSASESRRRTGVEVKKPNTRDFQEFYVEFHNIMNSTENTTIGILISPLAIDNSTKDDIYRDSGGFVEIFLYDEMIINPTKHILAQKHTKVPPDEVEQLLNDLQVTRDNLPGISASDVIARYWRFVPGDIIKINRKLPFIVGLRSQPMVKEEIYYRHVLAGNVSKINATD